MSYEKKINDYVIKFKDEQSYLEAKLENLKLHPDIPFLGFIQNEMYNREKCEVESIEEVNDGTQYISSVQILSGGSISENGDFGDIIVGSENLTLSGSLDYTINNGNSLYISTAGDNGANSNYNSFIGWSATDSHNGNSNVLIGGYPSDQSEELKEPEDPIENRFDILDL